VTVLVIVVIVLVVLVGINLVWRRARWPCPAWLVPALENPYFEAVAGASTLFERAGVEPGMSVLDAGCGPGRVTLPLSARVGPGGRVVALDLQADMIEKVRARVQSAGITNVELVHAGLGEGRLPAEAFDVALLVTVLGEIPEPVPALQEILRALRPGGLLSITEVLPDPHYQPVSRVRAFAAELGLLEEQMFPGWVSYTINLRKPADRS
jgi:ubiquinone/menaquinone biosynthesis C-methylase UbiE